MSNFSQLPSGVETLHENWWERLTPAGWEAQAEFYVPWASVDRFAEVCGGLAETFTVGTITYTRIVPLKWPRRDRCYCDAVEIKGDGASSLPAVGYGIDYAFAIARVHFGPVPWDLSGGYPMFTFQEELGAEMVTRPGTAYKFPSDNLLLNQRVGIRVPTKDIVLTAHNVQVYDPTSNVYDALVGCVNTVAFLGKAIGTLQYTGLSQSGQRTVGNVASWTLSHKLRWRAVAHNKIMRPDGTVVSGSPFEAPCEVNNTSNFLLPTADIRPILN